jgi:hypothetical protein
MANLTAPWPIHAGSVGLFIDQTGWIWENGSSAVLQAKSPAPERQTGKKKGGAMNAPPLEGSDTSVSSPKRQTAEAVRDDSLAKLLVSQASSYRRVIVRRQFFAQNCPVFKDRRNEKPSLGALAARAGH